VTRSRFERPRSRPRRSVLDPFKPRITRLLDTHPYSAQQIFQRLREEGYRGGITILRDYVRRRRFRPCPHARDGSQVRGGGDPMDSMANNAVAQNGPAASLSLPMRITASWFGSLAHRIQGCGTNVRAPHVSSPRIRHPDHTKCAVVLGAIKDEGLAVALTRHP
jgi:hypothetical protein